VQPTTALAAAAGPEPAKTAELGSWFAPNVQCLTAYVMPDPKDPTGGRFCPEFSPIWSILLVFRWVTRPIKLRDHSARACAFTPDLRPLQQLVS